MRCAVPSRDAIDHDTPLRLSIAATIAFPDGTMTASGLRREGVRGRLVIERIAGKDYTTLANIERMRELCRVQQKAPDSGCESADGEKLSGSSSTAVARSAQARARAISARLKKCSPTTSDESVGHISETGIPTKS
jgi:hypothetical protein